MGRLNPWRAPPLAPETRRAGGRLAAAREVEGRAKERVRALLDVVHRGELLLAVAPSAARGDEDHPGRADRRHVLGVVAGARENPPVADAGRAGGALDRGDHRAVERREWHPP